MDVSLNKGSNAYGKVTEIFRQGRSTKKEPEDLEHQPTQLKFNLFTPPITTYLAGSG